MTWSYGGKPGSTGGGGNRDSVRFLAGQLSSGDAYLVSDEEINFLLSQQGSNVYRAAAGVAQQLGSRYHAQPKFKKVGNLSISYGERAMEYRNLAARLRLEGAVRSALPYAGGISVSDKDAEKARSDRVAPAFAVGAMDNPSALGGSSS